MAHPALFLFYYKSSYLSIEGENIMKELRFAILGFGGIATSHKVAYDALAREGYPVRLVAICDKAGVDTKKTVTTNLGTVDCGSFEGIGIYTDLDVMLKECRIDVLDICLPTFLHKEFAIRALNSGLHVLCEKPMALNYADAALMLDAARENDRRLLIGQCLRFEPSYRYLKELCCSGELGAVRRISMSRLSAMPRWSSGDVYKQRELTGGCLLDLHIHDIDILRYLLGDPESVTAVATLEDSGEEYVSTRLEYDGVLAEATASFDEAASTPFYMGYRARFEAATVVLDMDKLTVYPEAGDPYMPKLAEADRIAEEIRYLCEWIRTGENSVNPPEESAATIRLMELIKESAATGERIGRGDTENE